MALYRAAVKRYPDVAALWEGLGYSASHAGFDEEAVPANQRALELEPENQELVNDLDLTVTSPTGAMRPHPTEFATIRNS